jgi:hypothetical protein
MGFFLTRSLQTICPSWFRTEILISTSWIARITGLSHWRLALLASCTVSGIYCKDDRIYKRLNKRIIEILEVITSSVVFFPFFFFIF